MGFFSKLWRGVKKVFKKIGKGVKKVFKKIGKWANKLGVVGQIAMMFIPFGQIFAPMFQGISSSFLGILGKGLASANPLIKGASWLVNAAYKTGQAVYKGFKTVTGAVKSFVGETAGFIGKKLNLNIEGAAGSFFGTGADSVLGRVGQETVKNWNGFKNAVGGIIEFNPTKTGLEYMERANLLKGEYRYQDDRLSKVPKAADIPVEDVSSAKKRSNFAAPKPMSATEQFTGYSAEELRQLQLEKAAADSITLNNNNNGTDGVINVDVKTDTVPNASDDKPGWFDNIYTETREEFAGNLASAPFDIAKSQLTQAFNRPDESNVGTRARNALDFGFGSRSFNISDVVAGLAPLITSPTNFYQSNEYNSLMSQLVQGTGGPFGNSALNLFSQSQQQFV